MAVWDATPILSRSSEALSVLGNRNRPPSRLVLSSVCLLVAYPRIRLSSCEARHPSAGDSSDNLIRVRTTAFHTDCHFGIYHRRNGEVKENLLLSKNNSKVKLSKDNKIGPT